MTKIDKIKLALDYLDGTEQRCTRCDVVDARNQFDALIAERNNTAERIRSAKNHLTAGNDGRETTRLALAALDIDTRTNNAVR